MNKENIINNTVNFVKNELSGEGSGHDWWHIHRVTELTKTMAEEENADIFICTLSALLHDIADEKLNKSEEEGIQKVRNWLVSQNVDNHSIEIVIEIISTISFKGGNGPIITRLESKIVQDADRIDAIGAIGIARCFVYTGAKGRVIHDPNIEVRENMSKEEYRNNEGTAINHFYEKLLKLKDLMNTDTGKRIAHERHLFMQSFLEQFYSEWDGKR